MAIERENEVFRSSKEMTTARKETKQTQRHDVPALQLSRDM